MIRPTRSRSASGRSVPARAARALAWGRRWLRGLVPPLREAPAIIMYHRVAEAPWDPWGMCVAPRVFRAQIQSLRARGPIMAMDALVDGLLAGNLPPRAMALTFDDGYADNARVAAPILEELGAPATFFLTTGAIGSGRPFWWDELAQFVLGGRAAAAVDLRPAGVDLQASWPGQDGLPAGLRAWRARQGAAGDPRRAAYLALWRGLQPLAPSVRESAMAHLRTRLADEEPLARDVLARPMSAAEARAIRSPLISLAAHGRSHAPLASLPPEDQRHEIEASRAELAEIAGSPPGGLAYPHGSHSEHTRAAAAAAGFAWAVTTRPGRIDPQRFRSLELPRIEAPARSARALLRRLRAV